MRYWILCAGLVAGMCWGARVEGGCGSVICESFLRGDANGDGEVSGDTSDMMYIINYVNNGGPAPDPMDAGDANDSGYVDNSDAVYLSQFIFYSGAAPPPPYPGDGFDPTADNYDPECTYTGGANGSSVYLNGITEYGTITNPVGSYDAWSKFEYWDDTVEQQGKGWTIVYDAEINGGPYEDCDHRGAALEPPAMEMSTSESLNPWIAPALMRGGNGSYNNYLRIDIALMLESWVDGTPANCCSTQQDINTRFQLETPGGKYVDIIFTDGTNEYDVSILAEAWPDWGQGQCGGISISQTCYSQQCYIDDYHKATGGVMFWRINGAELAYALCNLGSPPEDDTDLRIMEVQLADFFLYQPTSPKILWEDEWEMDVWLQYSGVKWVLQSE